MKKNRIAIILVVFLGIVAYWLVINKNDKGTIKQELRDFAVADTASITKIFLTDNSNRNITLEKIKKGEWKVNGKFDARNDAITVLLTTIKNVEVLSPVTKAAKENIIKSLASTATKIEIYQNDELAKVYYVGGETQDGLGTYMLLYDHRAGQNSSAPFIMFLPGFNGSLGVRYFTKEDDWKTHHIFNYHPDDIGSVKVEYLENPENSFEIFNNGNNSFEVKKIKDNSLLPGTEVLAMKKYLSYYQNIQYETLFNEAPDSLKDVVYRNMALAKITVTNKKNEQNAITIYHKPAKKGKMDINGKQLKYDEDRLYTFINGGKDFAVIQYFVFGKLMPDITFFQKKPVI